MLSSNQTRIVASTLVDRLGPISIAAAMLRAQQAERRGAWVEMTDWRRIARQALQRLAVSDPTLAAAGDGVRFH